MQAVAAFSSVHLGDVLVLIGLLLTYRSYKIEAKKQSDTQMTQHIQNSTKLENLTIFHAAQMEMNEAHSKQLTEMQVQTATLTQIASGQERRLQMLEDRGG